MTLCRDHIKANNVIDHLLYCEIFYRCREDITTAK